MVKLRTIREAMLILSVSICAVSQDNPPTQSTVPAPAFGQNAPILNPDNPPLSGLDEPSLELKTASRSFVSPMIQVGETGDSNGQNRIGGSGAEAITTLLGALDLQKFWPKSDLFLEYVGGAGIGNDPYYVRQLQAAGLEAVTRWRTGQFTLRDAFSYLPEGSYYAESGVGFPGYGIATGGLGLNTLPGIFHFDSESGAGIGVGVIPRLQNTALADVVQALTPRSALTFVGAYSNSHFYHNVDDLVNGDQTTVEGGYSHLVSRHDQVAAVYAFQLFRFPLNSGGEIYNQIVNLRWSHTISGRMSFIGEVGPQYTDLLYGGQSHTSWSPTGRAALRYRFEHASMMVSYEKFTSLGSGFFAGADTQLAQFSLRRPLGRTYDWLVEAGYSSNKRLQPLVATGVAANSYDEGFAGSTIRRHFGRAWDLFVAYRFAEVSFNVPITLDGATGKTNQRQIGTVGIEWHPKPTRIE
jgi:hypothetical protein